MQSKMQRLHLSFIRKLRKLKTMKISLQILIYLVIAFISIVIIATNTILGGLIIISYTVFCVIPTLVQKIAEIINYVDKE